MNRERQYPRELMFSSVVSVMMMATLGVRNSVNAAAKQARLGVSMQALYDKINRTEPGLMRALVQGSAQRQQSLQVLRYLVDLAILPQLTQGRGQLCQ